MKSAFQSERYFFSQNKWFIRMRPGDDKHSLRNFTKKIKFLYEDNIPVAGPFESKQRMFRWFESFISMYGWSRSLNKDYIPDSVANFYLNN
jgi:hypothetical protein